MNTNRKTAIVVGALYLISYLGVFVGSALLEPLLDAPDYLTIIYPNKPQVIVGVLLELVNGLAVVGIAVMMFPFLKKQSQALALGYVGMRIIECVMQIATDNGLLALVKLSQEFVKAGTPNASYYQTSGALLLTERQSADFMLTIFFSAGAGLFYYLLYQSKLVPRFISVWGLLATAAVLTINLLAISGVEVIIVIFALPIILNELFLAIWLLVKGFNPSATASASAKTEPGKLMATSLK